MRLLTGCISVAFFLFIPFEASFASNRLTGNFSSRKKVLLPPIDLEDVVFNAYLRKEDLDLEEIDIQPNDSLIDERSKIYLISQNLESAPFVELEIISDSQSWENENLFVAEGNAKAVLHGGILKADKIEIDKSKNTIFASGNVYFRKGKTKFSANSFRYSLKEKNGNFNNVFGVIDLKLIAKDLNLTKIITSNEVYSIDKGEDSIRDVELIDGFILQGGFDQNMEMIKHAKSKKNSINKWRIKAEKILLNQDGLSANKVSFTNDPFNPAQIRIESSQVEIIANDGKVEDAMITAKKSYLIFEDKLKLPLGNRSFRLSKNWKVRRKWTFGIDGNDKDGIFIGRQLNPIRLSDNYILSLQPQYLIQRSIQGKTSSYPKDGFSVNSSKVSTPTKFDDLFGLEAELQGKIFNWDNNIVGDISTFNSKRFANGSRFSAELTRKVNFKKFKELDLSLFGLYRDKVFNGSIGSADIYTAYGLSLSRDSFWKSGKTEYKDKFSTGLAKYQAEKLSSVELSSLWRSSLTYDLDIKYPLKEFNQKEGPKYNNSPYSPKSINPGLYLNSIFNVSSFIYEGSRSQSYMTFGLGPEITFGNLKKKYFDYTKLSIIPSYTFRSGESPFKFDNQNDLVKLKIGLTQQLVGPIIAKNVQEFNIDSSSENYGKSINSKLSIMWQRRAYEFGLFYDFKNDSGGLSFRLNGFNYNGIPEEF